MKKISSLGKFLPFIAAAAILSSISSTPAAEEPQQADAVLLDTYYRIEAKLKSNNLGIPLYLESADQDGRLSVNVYGIINHSFSSVLNALIVPANWCDIVSLHPNVKACTYKELSGMWSLTFYVGRKVYQSPEDTYQFTCHYRIVQLRHGYLDIVLNADEGPFGTKNHEMRFQAVPLDSVRTFAVVRYAYSYGFPLSFAEKIYYATFGRGKVGFTVKGADSDGNPVYIGGPRGSIERNAVRYYFGIQSFMDTMSYPEDSRFSMRISQWYDLTSPYRKQLYEMDKKAYLTSKTEEHKNQVTLQRQVPTRPH